MEIAISIVSIIGAICIGIYTIPNLYAVVKTRDTSGIKLSVFMMLFFGAWLFMINGIGLWISRGWEAGIGLVLSNIFSGGCTTITIIYKIKNMVLSKKNNMSETEYCKSLGQNQAIIKFENLIKSKFKKEKKVEVNEIVSSDISAEDGK